MVNDHLSHEEARLLIEERMKEAEAYGNQKRLGFSDSRTVRWAFVLFVIIVIVAWGVLL